MIHTLSQRESKLVELARRQAEHSTYAYFRHGAVLFDKSTVINSGFNKARFCSFSRNFTNHLYKSNLHAEISCILNVPKKLTRNASVIVVRINPEGQLRNSKPCPMCQGAMSFAGIRNVIYSVDDNVFEKIRLF